MFEAIARRLGFSKPSRTQMLLRYPKRGVQALLATKAVKVMARSPVATALGAAVAVPLTVMTVRRVRNDGEE